jgi:asparagine synthase (glutamine-hydrolysing)
MVGLFGYFSHSLESEKISTIAKSMGYTIAETTTSRFCILNSLDIQSANQQKTTTDNGKEIHIVTCGELYTPEKSDLKKEIITLYETGTLTRLKEFNGSFAAALYDDKSEKLILINDRYGTIKLFYHYNKEQFCFAPKIQPLLQLGAKKTIRKDAVFDFFLFKYILGDKTLFQDIYQLPPASILEVTKEGMKLTRYWTYDYSGHYDNRPKEELAIELGRRWQTSVERRIKKNNKIIIPLSGGLDSRAILSAALKCTTKDNIITYTFGQKGSYDFEIGQKIAESAGVKNIPIQAKKELFEKLYTISMSETEGMIDATPYIPLDIDEQIRNQATIIYSGQMGGEIMGPFIYSKIKNKKLNSEKNYDKIKKIIFDHHKFNDSEDVRPLFNQTFLQNLNILSSFEDSIKDFKNITPEQLPNYCAAWLYLNEADKYTMFCNIRYRNFFRYSLPFLDNDLIDFMLQVPPKLRRDKKLYKEILLKKYPELFNFPTKNTYGFTLNANHIAIFFKRVLFFLQRKLNSISSYLIGKDIYIYKTQNFLNYDDLLRSNKEYKKFMRIMIDKVKKREYFEQDYIEQLWNTHQKGRKNNARLLCLLVTFELFLEQYVDDSEIKQFNNRGL